MKPEHVVTLIGVAVAVLAIALFLIAIVVELRRTHMQLVTILGAVDDTVEQTDGLEAIVAEISEDLAAGQAALADCVNRLEQRLGGGGTSDGEPSAPVEPTNVFSNY
ncbi:MAG: hypothetical protein ACRDLS_03395 [Solirubrobacteraceae bacterium]